MADQETSTTAPARVNSNRDLSEQNAALDERLAKEAQDRRVKRAAAEQRPGKPLGAFHPLRPLYMVGAFTKGTVMGTLSSAGAGTRYGFWLGGAAGILGMVAMGTGVGAMALIAGFTGFMVAGAVLGAAVGMVTGGVRGVNRELKREAKEDQADARKAAGRPGFRVSLDDLKEQQRERGEINFDRSRQQDIENMRDNQTYWQDRVAAESNGWGMGR